MTPRQRDALAYIVAYQQQHGGVSPSYRQIAGHLGLRSMGGVVRLVRALEQQGEISRAPRRARSTQPLALAHQKSNFLAAADAYAGELKRCGRVEGPTAERFLDAHAIWRAAALEIEQRMRQTDIEDRVRRKVA